ncbi:MAG: hypothetical protein WAW88_11435 [Nocardioides sp.]
MLAPRAQLSLFALLACAGLLGWWLSQGPLDEAPRSAPSAAVTLAAEETDLARALAILRAWDTTRAAAYAAGDSAALRALYAPGSRTGARDVALLKRYAARGLRVEHLQMQLLRLELDTFEPERIVMRVTDRISGAVAVGAGGTQALPSDLPSTRTIEFVRAGDGAGSAPDSADESGGERAASVWRVREVQDAP